MQTIKRRETRDNAIIRLAMEARKRDTNVKVYRSGAEWFASSQSHPGTLHRVTAYSCDCRGFMAHGRCRHHSALLDYLGWLPTPTGSLDPDPGPEPPTSRAGRRHPFNLSDQEMIALKADAMKCHAVYGDPLINVETGEMIAA